HLSYSQQTTTTEIYTHSLHDALPISNLTPLAKYEVNEAIEAITIAHPTAKPETISIAVEAIINLEKSRTGKELLVKLAKLSDDRSEEHTSELQSRENLVCRLLLEKKK